MSFQALLKAAEQLQQRAERKRGAEAAKLFSDAVAKYREAVGAASSSNPPPAPDAQAACLFGLAESLQQGAEAVVAACAQLPDEQLSAEVVRQADGQASALLQEAVATFQRVVEGGQPRVDALVCAGNALSTWAEVAARQGGPAAALPLLQQAGQCYQAALHREEDALTWSNLADSLVQHASLSCEAGQREQGARLFGEALQAYQRACSLSDAADGDDVPGLLLNWGRGLLAAAQAAAGQAGQGGQGGAGNQAPAAAPGAAAGQERPGLDAAAALEALAEAERRLRQACEFLRGSEEPLLALGDVLLERGERLATAGDTSAAADSLQRALAEGYLAAQQISAGSPEAAVGVADVQVQLARLAAASGRGEAAAQHWAAAEAAYASALQRPTAFDFSERCDIRYNLACCLARQGRLQEAGQLLRQLAAVGGVAAADVAQDADLAGVAL